MRQAQQPKQTNPLWYGTYITGMAQLKFEVKFLIGLVIILFGFICFREYRTSKIIMEQARQQILVVETCKGESVAHPSGEYNTNPRQDEINAVAKKVVRLAFAVDPIGVEKSLDEAGKLMTERFRDTFLREMGSSYVSQVKSAGAIRVIEKGEVRVMTAEDTPAIGRGEVTPLDVIVTGNIVSYVNQQRQEKETAFAFHVNLVIDTRTDENPSGLLVDMIEKIDLKQKNGSERLMSVN